MVEPQSSPENRITQDTDQAHQVSVLLTLNIPDRFNTNRWPVQFVISDDVLCAGIRGGLDSIISMGLMEPGGGTHLVMLTFDDADYPDWLPKTTLAGRWCSRVIMPLLEHSLKGDMPESEGVQLWSLGTEIPGPIVERDTVKVSLRGEPKGEPGIRYCPGESGGPVYQASITIRARHMDFRAYRVHPNREELERELDAIASAGDVQVFGIMEDAGVTGEVKLEVMVERWGPVGEG